jgi:uncharacterized membrane protein YbhN (UPF0104 family)
MWLAAWLVTTALLVILIRQVDAARLLAALDRASWPWLGLAVAANVLILPVGALQWWILLPAGVVMRYARVLRIFSLTSVANNTTPSIVGHAAAGVMLAAEPGSGAAVGVRVIAIDQVTVGMAKAAVLILAYATGPIPSWMRVGLGTLIGGVAVLVVAIAGAAWLFRNSPSLVWLRMTGWGRQVPAAFVLALGVKAAEGLGIAAVQASFGLPVSVGSVSLALAATSLSSLVPIAPANVGPYEAASYAAYLSLGVDRDAALGIALVQHCCQLVAAILPGYLAMLRRPSQQPPLPRQELEQHRR